MLAAAAQDARIHTDSDCGARAGVGAATAIYAFVDATLVKPLPYREPARLMALFEHNPVGDRFHLSDFDYRRWKERNHVFTSLDVYRPERDTLNKPQGPEEVSGATLSDGFFRTLGVTPALGRARLQSNLQKRCAPSRPFKYRTAAHLVAFLRGHGWYLVLVHCSVQGEQHSDGR